LKAQLFISISISILKWLINGFTFKPGRANEFNTLIQSRLSTSRCQQWFETGRINVYVRKPAKLGKAYQLICNAFSFTGLVTDFKILEGILAGVRFKGAHYVFPVGVHLPKLTIDLFSQSNGMTIKVGDESHPDSLEVIASYPDWAERNERLIGQPNEVLRNLGNFGSLDDSKHPGEGQKKPEYLS